MGNINEKINDIAIKEYKGNNSSFAKAMGTSEANIRNYRKDTIPKLDFIVKIHEEFGISFEYLLSNQIEVGNYTTIRRDSNYKKEILNKMTESENIFLKEKIKFQEEQINFYKLQIDFLSTQCNLKIPHPQKNIEDGIKIIEEIENIALKKSIK